MLTRVGLWWKFRRAVFAAGRQPSPAPGQTGRRDVVLVPCWRRPEFLWHCLDNLTRAEGAAGVHVVFSLDSGASPENLQVIGAFADRLPSHEVRPAQPCPYRRTKQSANLLLAYLAAAGMTDGHVFLVEEDIMVARDFLRWHRAVHASVPELFCSIAVRNPNRIARVPDDPGAYYLSSGDYASHAVCFDARVLRTLVRPHVNPRYFARPKRYVRRHFPHSAVGLGFVEQDGLLRRIQEVSGRPIAYACVPRAFDAGFYGYNRPGGLTGSLPERIEGLAATIYDVERLSRAGGTVLPGQCVPVNLEPAAWTGQRRVEVQPAA